LLNKDGHIETKSPGGSIDATEGNVAAWHRR